MADFIKITRNIYKLIDGITAELWLTRGYVCLVDVKDLPLLTNYRWCANVNSRGRIDAVTMIQRKLVPISRFILSCPSGLVVDHINGNTLDNRRKNIRIVTKSQNGVNKGLNGNNRSGYKGVSYNAAKNKYVAFISVRGKMMYLGRFDFPELAARAYDAAAKEFYGASAKTNFEV